MGVLRHLVVVVPGIGGSVLTAPDGTSAWDVTVRALTHAVIDPGVLDIDRELVATGLVDTLTVLRPWLVVPGYDGLTRQLQKGFGGRLRLVDYCDGESVPGEVDVLRVPYDFRRSVAVSADVLGRAVTTAVGGSGREVIVVAHSMGGLVARYWIGVGGGWRHCRALVTLGTPHRGAPRALDWLFNGAGVGLLRSGAATRELRRWPSVFELLPQYPAVLPEVGEPVEPTALSPTLVRAFGSADAGAEVLRRVGEAAKVHADIAAAWEELPGGGQPGLVVFFGRGHKTPNRAVVHNGRVRVAKVDPQWRGNVGWAGDGTVPAISSIPAELSRQPERAQALPDKHGAMGSTAAVLERLVTMQGEDLPVRGTDRPAMPWVGWDVEEVAPAGTGIEVGAEVHHGTEGPQDVVGSAATVVVTGGADPLVVPMTWGEQGWRAVLPPLPVGSYKIDVEVKGAWHGTSVYASTPLVVVDRDGDGQP
jgi:hypothetical protein